jgi:hypothetical protein
LKALPWPDAVDWPKSVLLSDGVTEANYDLRRFTDTGCTSETPASTPVAVAVACGTPKTTFHLQLVTSDYQNDICQLVFEQYAVALLNMASGACAKDETFAALMYLGNMLWNGTEACQSQAWLLTLNEAQMYFPQWEAQLAVLECYNGGCAGIVEIANQDVCLPTYGPEHCPVGSFNASAQCPQPPDDCPYYPCEGGCTQSQGYWKNHRLSKKRKRSHPWDDVCAGQEAYIQSYPPSPDCGLAADCPLEKRFFFGEPSCISGRDLYTLEEVISTPSAGGQACLIAGRQIIAAELNSICTGACVPPPIAFALAGAKSIVQQYCVELPCDSSSGLDSSVTNTTLVEARRQALEFAELLTGYNTGFHGPGHCPSGSGLEGEDTKAEIVDVDPELSPPVFWTSFIIFFACMGLLIAAAVFMASRNS